MSSRVCLVLSDLVWSYLVLTRLSRCCSRWKGFSALSAEAGDLTLEGDYLAAAANILLNVATAGVALLARVKVEVVLVGRGHAA